MEKQRLKKQDAGQLRQRKTDNKPLIEVGDNQEFLSLQSEIGNQAMQRLIANGDDTGRFSSNQSIQRALLNARKNSERPSAPPVVMSLVRPNHIQRLNTDENYYYSKITTIHYQSKKKEDQAADKRATSALRARREWKSFINALRIYTLWTTANKVNKARIDDLKENLFSLWRHAASLEAFVKYDRFAALGGTDTLQEGVKALMETALEDLREDLGAISVIQSDNGLQNGSMSWQQALFVARMGTRPSEILSERDLAPGGTGPGGMGPQHAPGSPQKLGGGQVSEVTALSYSTSDGGSERRVFKPNEARIEGASISMDLLNVQSAYRVMAAARLQNLIKAKMVQSNRTFDTLLGNIDIGMYGGKVGFVADLASGKDVMKSTFSDTGQLKHQSFLNVKLDDVKAQRQLANLQLFDVLTGQLDRHMGNVMISQGPNGTKVTGIDNDFAFKAGLDSVKAFTGGRFAESKTRMPDLIDKYFGMAILQMTEQEVRAALQGLQVAEINSTVSRFDEIKDIIQDKLDKNELIALPGDETGGERSWKDIDVKEYNPSDYMGQLVQNRKEAFDAVKKKPSIEPEQNEKGDWVLNYDPPYLSLTAGTPDGSDLWELVQEARQEAKREQYWKRRMERRKRGYRAPVPKSWRRGMVLSGHRK